MATQFEHPSFDCSGHLARRVLGTMRALRERLQATFFITCEPHMDCLATHVELLGHLGDRETISQDAEHGVITLFHFA
jgi:hypothetical protein